jgi:hypothetical protein
MSASPQGTAMIDDSHRDLVVGGYYSESVQQDAPEINEFMRSIGYGGRAPTDSICGEELE